MPFFHCSSSLLAPGSVLQAGNWGRIIRNFGWGHNQALKEAALEHIRQTEFSDKPSRWDSTFMFDDENEVRFYANSDRRELMMLAYEVELLEPNAPRHNGDWRRVSPEGTIDLEWARNYWRGTHYPPVSDAVSCREVLTTSAVRIIRRL